MRLAERDLRATAFWTAIFVVLALMIPMLGSALAVHPAGSCLDLEPETADNPVLATHTVTATLRPSTQTPVALPATSCEASGAGSTGGQTVAATSPVTIDFEISGPGDPQSDGNTPGSPDRECTIDVGEWQCDMPGYSSSTQGTDTIRGWIDHDDNQSTFDGDATEAQNPGPTGGTDVEPDDTDVVTKTWTAGAPASLDCDDESGNDDEVNPSTGTAEETTETYTCTVRDAQGNPTNDADPEQSGNQNITVRGENEAGANDPDPSPSDSPESPDYSCTISSSSDPTGTCQIDVAQSRSQTGAASLCFFLPGEDAVCDGEAPAVEDSDKADKALKTWEARRTASVDAEPEADTNTVGESHTITATVYDQFGGASNGTTQVFFEIIDGPSDTDGNDNPPAELSCTTPSNGNTCSVTYSQTQTAGTDTICVYLDQDQTASGTQGPPVSGTTCGGESLNDPDDDPGTADPPDGADDQDVVQKTWQPSGAASRLDCTPETDNNAPGESHTVTCTSTNSSQTPTADTNIDIEATGANDPDNGNSPTSPDFTCTTNQSGTCSFTHATNAQSPTGTTTYRAWIDSDNSNNSPEADATEGQAEGQTAGSKPEPDDTDVVTKTWTTGGRAIDCSPESASNPSGTNHTITCNVKDRDNQNLQGQTVTATESGSGQFDNNSSTQTKTTDANGNVAFIVKTATTEQGTQSVTASLPGSRTDNITDECERPAGQPTQTAIAGVCSDTVDKTWTGPTTPPTGFPRSVTLEASKNKKTYGKQFTLTATVTGGAPETPQSCISGVTVELERTVVGSTTVQQVGTATTNSEGIASFTRSADKSANYVAHLDQDAQCSEANSAPETVKVKKAVALRLSKSKVDRGDRVRLVVKVRPCGPPDGQGHQRDRVVLYKRVKGTMAKIDAKRTNQECKAVFRKRIRKNSVFQARSPKQDADHLGGRSRKKAVQVR